MKKVMSMLLVLVLVLSLIGCGGKSEEKPQEPAEKETTEAKTEEAEEPETAEEPKAADGEKNWTIAVVPKDSTNPWFVRMEEGVKKYADETGLNVFQKGPSETDAALQIQVVEDLISQDVDALCVVPHDPSAMEPVLKKAREKGIVVITHEASSQENCDYDLEAFNYDEYGGYIMDTLSEAMGGEGKYVCMVGSLTNDSHNQEADGAIARQEEKYPDMVLIEERVETEDNPEVAYNKAKELLKKYPDLKGIVGTSSFDAPGAGRAIEEAGLIGKVFTCGTGMPATNKALLDSGAVSALTLWDPADAGYAMCKLATMVLEGEEIKEGTSLGFEGYDNLTMEGKVLTGQAWITITKENVDSFGF